MKWKIITIFLLTLIAIPSVNAWSINPAKWTFYNVDDYELKPISFDIDITNPENGPIKVKITVIDPEYLYEGNEPLPDKSWIHIQNEGDLITVPANSTVEIPVLIDIPEEYTEDDTIISNYNKSYEAWLLADMVEGPGNIQIDYRCRWVFKTPLRYVPPQERPGYVDYTFYLMLFGAVILLSIVTLISYKKLTKKKSVKTKSRRKKYQEDDDIF